MIDELRQVVLTANGNQSDLPPNILFHAKREEIGAQILFFLKKKRVPVPTAVRPNILALFGASDVDQLLSHLGSVVNFQKAG